MSSEGEKWVAVKSLLHFESFKDEIALNLTESSQYLLSDGEWGRQVLKVHFVFQDRDTLNKSKKLLCTLLCEVSTAHVSLYVYRA